MDKPKCRVCLVKHWAHEPHVFAESKPNAVTCARCVELEREVSELRLRLDGRRTYQREYMRKRRAK